MKLKVIGSPEVLIERAAPSPEIQKRLPPPPLISVSHGPSMVASSSVSWSADNVAQCHTMDR
jgi:hypothetical protein